jgi:hypothetical protein
MGALRFPLLPGHSPLFALAPVLSTPSRPRSLALALHLSDARSVFSSCRSLLSGLYRPRSDTLRETLLRALTSRLSPLARAFASVPCRSRLFSPFLTNRHCLSRPSLRVSVPCATLSPAHTGTHTVHSQSSPFPSQSSDPSRRSILFTATTNSQPGRHMGALYSLIVCFLQVPCRLPTRGAHPVVVCSSCSAESSGSVVRTRVGGRGGGTRQVRTVDVLVFCLSCPQHPSPLLRTSLIDRHRSRKR